MRLVGKNRAAAGGGGGGVCACQTCKPHTKPLHTTLKSTKPEQSANASIAGGSTRLLRNSQKEMMVRTHTTYPKCTHTLRTQIYERQRPTQRSAPARGFKQERSRVAIGGCVWPQPQSPPPLLNQQPMKVFKHQKSLIHTRKRRRCKMW